MQKVSIYVSLIFPKVSSRHVQKDIENQQEKKLIRKE